MLPVQAFAFRSLWPASLHSVESLVRGWLPTGRRQGDEWVAIKPTVLPTAFDAGSRPLTFEISLVRPTHPFIEATPGPRLGATKATCQNRLMRPTTAPAK
jgi:hypothetical protein